MNTLGLLLLLLSARADTAALDSVGEVVKFALYQTTVTKYYDPAYTKIPYPNGDVPLDRGVCTDVVIRALRNVGIDLQKLVHEDMAVSFGDYPRNWGLKAPDPNIDHRRVPNLMTFFARRGKSLAVTDKGRDYLPGDIVCWKLSNGLDHIGMVVDVPVEKTDRMAVVHNIGNGAQLEDVLFGFTIIGHYRYFSGERVRRGVRPR